MEGIRLADYSRESVLSWLSSAGIMPELLCRLLETEPDPVRILQQFRSGKNEALLSLPEAVRASLQKNSTDRVLHRWDTLLQQHKISALTISDRLYPARLRLLSQAPAVLFYQGSLNALEGPGVSVVGSRNATYKGLEATRKITEELSRCGITVISGLAYGIDAAAHTGCLKGGSPTIAVLGCGLDQNYPRENEKLRAEILRDGGLLLSEFTPGEKPLGWHFPYRNRIISGLGDCLAVMEARIRSGSMTTVQHALEQGKDVFVYPGEAGNPKCEGNHQLLREGAIFFTAAEDLMEDMGWLDKLKNVGQNNEHARVTPKQTSPEEQGLLDELEKGAQSFDQLCDRLQIPASRLNVMLSMLQIQGAVRALPGKMFEMIRD